MRTASDITICNVSTGHDVASNWYNTWSHMTSLSGKGKACGLCGVQHKCQGLPGTIVSVDWGRPAVENDALGGKRDSSLAAALLVPVLLLASLLVPSSVLEKEKRVRFRHLAGMPLLLRARQAGRFSQPLCLQISACERHRHGRRVQPASRRCLLSESTPKDPGLYSKLDAKPPGSRYFIKRIRFHQNPKDSLKLNKRLTLRDCRLAIRRMALFKFQGFLTELQLFFDLGVANPFTSVFIFVMYAPHCQVAPVWCLYPGISAQVHRVTFSSSIRGNIKI